MHTNGSTTGLGSVLFQALPSQQEEDVVLVKPKTIRNGIVLYGKVASSEDRRCYTVRKKHVGSFRYSYQCTCDGWFLGGYPICRHLALFKLAETEVASNETEGTVDAGVLAR